MKRLFDPAAIRAQIANLQSDRDRIDQAIQALESALRNIEDLDSHQKLLTLDCDTNLETTLLEAVKRACFEMADDITRPRVLASIMRAQPLLQPNSSSVSAALINLSKGDNPMLTVAKAGRGRTPAVYATQGNLDIQLNSDELAALFEPINGVGGLQSLFESLQKQFDKATGVITLTPLLRARIHHYFHAYGTGGYQTRARRAFRRTLPHLFTP